MFSSNATVEFLTNLKHLGAAFAQLAYFPLN
jgi:hypothetical protein